MADVFIVYDSSVENEALRIKKLLNDNGLSTELPPRGSSMGGTKFAYNVADSIEKCRMIVFIVSRGSGSCPWISKELTFATDCKKPIIPYITEHFTPCKELGITLANLQAIRTYELPDADGVLIDSVRSQLFSAPHTVKAKQKKLCAGYSGSFISGTHTGKGKYVWTNGDVYSGDFVDGLLCGKGTLRFSDGDCYKGEFRNDQFHGKGTYIWASGMMYEGTFYLDDITGNGRFTSRDGSYCTGTFENGEPVNAYLFSADHEILAIITDGKIEYK